MFQIFFSLKSKFVWYMMGNSNKACFKSFKFFSLKIFPEWWKLKKICPVHCNTHGCFCMNCLLFKQNFVTVNLQAQKLNNNKKGICPPKLFYLLLYGSLILSFTNPLKICLYFWEEDVSAMDGWNYKAKLVWFWIKTTRFWIFKKLLFTFPNIMNLL